MTRGDARPVPNRDPYVSSCFVCDEEKSSSSLKLPLLSCIRL